MRLAFVYTLIVIGGLYSWSGPFAALLFYLWVAYFRPDFWIGYTTLIWQLNLSYFTGLFLLLSTIVTRQTPRFGVGPLLMGLFLLQSYLSTLLSPAPGYSWVFWRMFAPSIVTAYLIVVLVTNEKRLRHVFLAITLSLSFEGAKQGWLQLVLDPGGQNYNEWPMLGDNNGVAVGMYMVVPVLLALAQTATRKGERTFHRFLAFGVLYRAIATYSRGGFLACSALGMHYLMRSKRKFAAIAAIAITILIIAPVLPEAFWARMQTIQVSPDSIEQEDTDSSIRSRIHFWKVALLMTADRPLTGVGFSAFNAVYDDYDFTDGQFGRRRSVHSVWFATLCETGIPGFAILAVFLVVAIRTCRRARRLAERRPDCQNLAAYGTALEAAFVAFAIGGTFVNFNNEMLWHYLALSVALDRLVTERAAEPVPDTVRSAVSALQRPTIAPAALAMAPARHRAIGRA